MCAGRIRHVKDVFERYFLELRKAYADKGTEHSGRTALENFLNAVAARVAPKVRIQQEPLRQGDKGAPDFKVTQTGMILGYVENKPIDTDLNRVLKSEQIKKYLDLTGNLLLTDYLHFIWIKGDSIQRDSLAFSTDLADPKFKLRGDRIESVCKLLDGFFSTPPRKIGQAQELAVELAKRGRLLRDYLSKELLRQERDQKGERLYGLYQVFHDQVFHELTLQEFADAFAQMLAYSLFLAKLNAGNKAIDLHNVKQFIPGSFSLIRELAEFLDVLENDPYRDIRWVVEEILSIINSLDLAAIHEDLSFRQRRVRRGIRAKSEEEARLFERDPFVYFYEDYLSRYDPELRETRGVYYTPPPVVNFIVRAIDDILKDKDVFGIRDGLADHKRVTVLDFACGTGTFLVEVFERIFENIGGPKSAKADLIVRDHMLKNIFGFEYLIAPYTVAHLKLSQ
jgi:N-6 DNA methylase